jgi:hypothetical protein
MFALLHSKEQFARLPFPGKIELQVRIEPEKNPTQLAHLFCTKTFCWDVEATAAFERRCLLEAGTQYRLPETIPAFRRLPFVAANLRKTCRT